MFMEVFNMKKFSTYIIIAILTLSSVTANAAVIPRETLPLNATENQAQIVENLDPEQGLVFANDLDPRRCHNLVHNLQRVGTQNVLVTCQKAQSFEIGRAHV